MQAIVRTLVFCFAFALAISFYTPTLRAVTVTESGTDASDTNSGISPSPDLISVSVEVLGTDVHISVRVSPGSIPPFDPITSRGKTIFNVFFDLDQDPTTGTSTTNPPTDVGIFGAEVVLEFTHGSDTGYLTSTADRSALGTVPVTSLSDGFDTIVPLALLGDDGNFSFKVLDYLQLNNQGDSTGILDTLPDTGLPAGVATVPPPPQAAIAVQQPAGTPLKSRKTTVDFGSVTIHGSKQLVFTVVNEGSANLTDLSLSVTGTNKDEFKAEALAKTLLTPSESTTFTVKYMPSHVGLSRATLHVASNDPAMASFEVPLTAKANSGNLYPTVAGFYDVVETYSYVITDPTGTHNRGGTGKGSVRLDQNGQEFSYNPLGSSQTGFDFTRRGVLSGNNLTINGLAVPPDDALPGVTIVTNIFNATGTISDGQIVIHGTGLIILTKGNQTQRIDLTSTATLTGDVIAVELAKVKVYIAPPDGGTVSGSGFHARGTVATLTPVWNPGFYFVNWTEGDVVVSSGPNYSLTVDKNHTLTAHFARLHTGLYTGLLMGQTAPANDGVGFFRAMVDATGAFTAKLKLGGATYRMSGGFNRNWKFKRTIQLANQPDLVVNLHLDPASGQLSGTLQHPDGSFAASLSEDPVSVTTDNPTPFAGKFTILLRPDPAHPDPTLPQGSGYLTMQIRKSGDVTAIGQLADGAIVSASGLVGANNVISFYSVLYGPDAPHKGSIFGDVMLHTAVNGDYCDGILRWFKPLQSNRSYYRNGFAEMLILAGARYVSPPDGMSALNFSTGANNGLLALKDGGLADQAGHPLPIEEQVTLAADNSVSISSANGENLKLKIDAASGTFSGSFMHPASQQRITFAGVLYQKENDLQAGGFFLGPIVNDIGLSGDVLLTPAP